MANQLEFKIFITPKILPTLRLPARTKERRYRGHWEEQSQGTPARALVTFLLLTASPKVFKPRFKKPTSGVRFRSSAITQSCEIATKQFHVLLPLWNRHCYPLLKVSNYGMLSLDTFMSGLGRKTMKSFRIGRQKVKRTPTRLFKR